MRNLKCLNTIKAIVPLTFFLMSINLFGQQFTYGNNWGPEGISLKSSGSSGVTVNYSVHEMNLEDVNVNGLMMKAPRINGMFLPNNEGFPDLAGTGRYIAVPQGANAILNVKSYKSMTYYNVDIAPAPRIPWDNENGPLVFSKKQEVYGKNSYYPLNPVILSEPCKVRGVDAVILGITPFQYNPVTKELIVYTDLDIEVSFIGGNNHFGEDRLRSRWWDPLLEDIFINYSSLPAINYNWMYSENLSREAGCEYLIIRPDGADFAKWADSIRNFRTLQGIKTNVVTITEAGGNVATSLESYVNNAYNTWTIPPCAVLILGDFGTSTANNIISPIYNNYCASDNILADVNGDDMPDITFARITANDDAQLQVMVTKFLNYERNPPTAADFYDKPITALGWQTERWFQICSETIGGFWKNSQGKHPVRINAIYSGSPSTTWSTATNTSTVLAYFGPAGQSYIPATPQELGGWSGGTAAMVNNAINSGSFMLTHRDHGGETGWGEPSYSNGNINSLTNVDNKLPFVFSLNCLTGRYNYGSECFAEKFHRYTYNNQNSGALGLIAASQTSYSFVNDAYAWGMMDNFWPNFMPTYGTNPASRGVLPAFGNSAGKYFLQQSNWPYNTSNKAVTYHLFHHHGDAFLTVFTEAPQSLSVSHANVINAGDTSFSVNATSGAFISLSFNGQVLGTGTGTGSSLSIHVTPGILQSTDSMNVVVTKQNCFRYHAKVRVSPLVGITGNPMVPDIFSLSQNHPNPFNPVTTIEYAVPELSFVNIKVYDVLGREITSLVNEVRSPGYYNVEWNALNFTSGVYFCKMTAGNFSDIKKMVIIK